MQEINIKWACGNFLVALATEVEADGVGPIAQNVLEKGVLYYAQRQSAVDKVLGGFEKDEAGKEKRKAGWKRGEVGFSPALAEKLSKVFEELPISETEKLDCLVNVSEYIPSTSESKFVDEKEIVGRHESKGDLEEWLKTVVGFDGESHGEDGEFDVKMLTAVREFKRRMLKGI